MSPGDLEVQSGAKTLFEGDFDFNVPDFKPVIAYAVDGGTGTLKVSQGSASGSHENTWRLRLDETTPVDVSVTLGAGDATLVLGRINLQSLTIRRGAGNCPPASVFRRARLASSATPTSAASSSAMGAGSIPARKARPSRSI